MRIAGRTGLQFPRNRPQLISCTYACSATRIVVLAGRTTIPRSVAPPGAVMTKTLSETVTVWFRVGNENPCVGALGAGEPALTSRE